MKLESRIIAELAQPLYLPSTDADGRACVVIARPGETETVLPCRDKEEACFWARLWVRQDRVRRMEENVFGSNWLGSTKLSFS